MRKPSPATILAALALFFAVGGTAAAAHHYLLRSTSQISPAVQRALHGKSGPAGAPGPAGPAGPAGAQGPAGPTNLSTVVSVDGPIVEVPNGEVGSAKAACPAGSHAIGGGGSGGIAGIMVSERETNPQEWFIITLNQTGITIKIHAEAECAAAGQAVAARVSPSTGSKRLALERSLRSQLGMAGPTARAACGRGVSATIGGKRKCLGAGEYCATRYERQYERYGFVCSTRYRPPRLRRK